MFSDDSKPDRGHARKPRAILKKKKYHGMNNKLFVGNLSFNTTENDLQDAFAAHGTVLEANLMMDRATGRPRGFAFVTMSTEEEAQKAISALNGANMDGRNLTVNVARAREERSGGGGGRGGHGGGGGGRGGQRGYGGPRRH
jgi:cold-inducible RNA-binding protein